jgi:hypothetical protein
LKHIPIIFPLKGTAYKKKMIKLSFSITEIFSLFKYNGIVKCFKAYKAREQTLRMTGILCELVPMKYGNLKYNITGRWI